MMVRTVQIECDDPQTREGREGGYEGHLTIIADLLEMELNR